MSVRAPLAVLAAALVAASTSASTGRAADPCGRAGYSYAGLQHGTPTHGVSATIALAEAPHVQSGHVAAWVGVGGVGLGAGGTTAWIQVGLNGFRDGTNRLYYEVAVPGAPPRYVELRRGVAVGERHRVAVLELSGRREWWRVWVDGRPVSDPVHLPGSGGRWRPWATTESWDGGRPACNRFAYAFHDVRVAAARGGSWRGFRPAVRLEAPGYAVVALAVGSFRAGAARSVSGR